VSLNASTPDTGVRILLVEDDVRLSTLIQEYLQQQAMVVAIEHRGDLACQRIIDERPDLVVLDLMLPGMDAKTYATINKYVEGVVLSDNLEALFRNVPPPLCLALAMTEKHEKVERAQIMRERDCSELEAV